MVPSPLRAPARRLAPAANRQSAAKGPRPRALLHRLLRNWRESDKPEKGYSIQDLANDAEALIRMLELTRYVLIGHSMGGKVAQLLASKRAGGPGRIDLSRASASNSNEPDRS